MCTALPETSTEVPVLQLVAPSSLYCVLASPPLMPEPEPSSGVRCTVTVLRQPVGASSVVAGAVVSMRTMNVLAGASTLPATSVERYS